MGALKQPLAIIFVALLAVHSVHANDPFGPIIDMVAGVAKIKTDMAQSGADAVKTGGEFAVETTTNGVNLARTAVDTANSFINTLNEAVTSLADFGSNGLQFPNLLGGNARETRAIRETRAKRFDRDDDTVEDLKRNRRKNRRQQLKKNAQVKQQQKNAQVKKQNKNAQVKVIKRGNKAGRKNGNFKSRSSVSSSTSFNLGRRLLAV